MNKWEDATDRVRVEFSARSIKMACGFSLMNKLYGLINPSEDRIAKINMLEMFT